MYKLTHNGSVVAQSEQPIDYVDYQFGWQVGDRIFMDVDKEMTVSVEGIKVSPIEFKLLFSAAERVAIKTSTDPIILDFFSIVEDPRLTEVNLALQSTQDSLDYLTTAKILAEGRKAEILTGVIK